MIGVILAGGAGRRFWPMSREDHPKQLLRIWDDEPMIQKTVDRTRKVTDADKILVVCGPHLIDSIKQALPELSDENFLVEPAPRNTAPAIGLAATFIKEKYGNEPLAIFPSDHYIGGLNDFESALSDAGRVAENGYIVTMGIQPNRPETGYGYIHYKTPLDLADSSAYQVESFVEKPDPETALKYLESGDYAWNSGMFVFKPSVLLDEMSRQLPEMYESMETISNVIDDNPSHPVLEKEFKGLQDISIDYGIMEEAKDVAVIPANFQWSDVGHWAALDEVCDPDDNGNIVRGESALIETTNCTVYSQGRRFVATVGLEDTVVVDTEDALLVVSKSNTQDVRDVISHLEGEGRHELL